MLLIYQAHYPVISPLFFLNFNLYISGFDFMLIKKQINVNTCNVSHIPNFMKHSVYAAVEIKKCKFKKDTIFFYLKFSRR